MSDEFDFKAMNAPIIEEFRANGGKCGGWFEGAHMLLLHTTGRKSGAEHITPLVYLPDGDRYIVFASKGGAPADPDWYRNMVAKPEVTIEVGTETFAATATVLGEPERTEKYAAQVKAFASFAEYEQKAGRVIPAIALTRA